MRGRFVVWFGCALAVASIDPHSARSQQPDPAAVAAPAKTLAAAVDAAIAARNSQLGDAVVAVSVVDVNSGDELFSRGADQQLNTASNTKIVTAAAALALLGPDHTFDTGLYGSAPSSDGSTGDLYLRGGGDPLLTQHHLDALAADLRHRGVRRVRGHIVVDGSLFDDQHLPPKFDEQPHEQAGFRAPVHAAGVNFSMFNLWVVPSPSGAGPARVIIDPPSRYVRIVESAVITSDTGRARVKIRTRQRSDSLEVRVAGQIRPGGSSRHRMRAPDPMKYAGALLRRSLDRHGIGVGSSKIETGTTPGYARELANHRSAPLSTLVRGLGKYSNNYMAEMLLKNIGAATRTAPGPATWEDGLAAGRAYLVDTVGLEQGTFRFDNGSGLFDSNAFSAKQIAKILAVAAADPTYASDFHASLAIAGTDGTLARRMTEGEATRLVRAKTGTLAEVSALSGFAAVDARRLVAFSVLVNQVPRGHTDHARDVQDAIAEAVVGVLQRGQ